jgi:hypothetical protein
MIPIIGSQGVQIPINVSLDAQPDGTMSLKISQGIMSASLPMDLNLVKSLRDLLSQAYDRMRGIVPDASASGKVN